uniref:DUF5673 domain-containing protein n=1 Tax=Anaerococcus mediterraneensis TaxID=1870984 RepID=UPI000931DF79|nr:DUF5673 domain-containing protein [Anaerococcus mediterraneensis]
MKNFDMIIIAMYALITAFFIYRVFKQQRAKAAMKDDVVTFKRPISSLEWILFGILLATGGVNLYQGIALKNKVTIITAAVMILLSVVFIIYTTTKLQISSEGMLVSSGFVAFKDLKKWGFDSNVGELVMAVKRDRETTRETVKVRKEDIDEINRLIRKYKLGK